MPIVSQLCNGRVKINIAKTCSHGILNQINTIPFYSHICTHNINKNRLFYLETGLRPACYSVVGTPWLDFVTVQDSTRHVTCLPVTENLFNEMIFWKSYVRNQVK